MIRPFALAALAAALALPNLAQAAGDPAHGGVLFKQRCAVCHVSAEGAAATSAPNLFGVVGRKAGTAAGFHYSTAMTAYGQAWGASNLDSFLAAPSKLVPGTRMYINVAKPEDRADLIAYLSSLKK